MPLSYAGPYDTATNRTEVLDYAQTYMSRAHRPDELLEIAQHYLKGIEFDTFVGTGLSGALAVPELARKLDKHYLIVRKPNDSTHSYFPVEGRLGRRWVFLDDLVGTGATFSRVWDTLAVIQVERRFQSEYQGALLYTDREFVTPTNRRTNGWLRKSKYTQRPEPSWTVEVGW